MVQIGEIFILKCVGGCALLIRSSKKGAVVTMIAIFMSLLFPVVQFSIIDIGRMYIIKEHLRFHVQSAATSAVTMIDWEDTYYGDFRFDVDAASSALHQCLSANLDLAGAGTQVFLDEDENISRYQGAMGNISYYAEVYNDVRETTALGGSRIPPEFKTSIEINASVPSIFVIIRYKYKPNLLNIFARVGAEVDMVQYASAVLRSTEYEDN